MADNMVKRIETAMRALGSVGAFDPHTGDRPIKDIALAGLWETEEHCMKKMKSMKEMPLGTEHVHNKVRARLGLPRRSARGGAGQPFSSTLTEAQKQAYNLRELDVADIVILMRDRMHAADGEKWLQWHLFE